MSHTNTTITVVLEDDLADWVYRSASSRKLDPSELISHIVKEAMLADHEYERAMQEALKFRNHGHSTGPYLTRDEMYDRRGRT